MAKLASPLHFLSSAIATWNKGTIRKFNRGLLSWLHRSIDGKNMHQKAHLSGEAHFYQIGNIRLFKWIPWSGLWLGWGWSRGAWGACLRFGGVHALFGGWPGVRKRNILPKCIMLYISQYSPASRGYSPFVTSQELPLAACLQGCRPLWRRLSKPPPHPLPQILPQTACDMVSLDNLRLHI